MSQAHLSPYRLWGPQHRCLPGWMAAAVAAMTHADWKFIETVIEALRKRYPALQIELGRWCHERCALMNRPTPVQPSSRRPMRWTEAQRP